VAQLIEHVVLIVALPTAVVAALVVVVVPVDAAAAPGTTQVAWHVAACELQAIMQVVVVNVCAKRIFSPANAALANPPIAGPSSATTAITTAHARMTAFPGRNDGSSHHSPVGATAECRWRGGQSMIPKSGSRFSDKIMLKRKI
jgi:hypothetical protein